MEACNDITVMVKFNGEDKQDKQLVFTRVPCINEKIIADDATYQVDSVTHLANSQTAIIEVKNTQPKQGKASVSYGE